MNLKLQKLLLIIFSLVLFSACAAPQKVYLKCNYKPVPERPIKEDFENYQLYLKAIFMYTYELESLKEYCIY